jgi:hypothetical protein
MLWNDSHESWREFLIRCLTQNTNKSGITKEAAVDNFVQIHNGQGAQAKTGLHFNPASVTEANRLKANCATFWRYVDKEELFDMLPYVLASMSDEHKLAFASQYLRPAGIACRLADEGEHDEFNFEAAANAQAAACDAMKAMTAAALNPTAENLEIAEREADKANQHFKRTRAMIAAARKACTGAKAAIGKLVHRKDKVTA